MRTTDAVAVFVIGAMLTACAGDATPSDAAGDAADSGVDGATLVVAPPTPPSLPTPPSPPQFSPCPEGWSERVDPELELTVCEPWLDTPADCPANEVRLPGEPACRLVGAPCPTSGFSPDLPAGVPTLYVDAAATAPFDGTLDQPFVTIADAVAVASRGTVVAIAAGTYAESVRLPAGVTLFGACVAGTRIAPTRSTAPALLPSGLDTAAQNLGLSGAGGGALVERDRSLTLRDVVMSDIDAFGVRVDGGRLELENVVIRDVRPGLRFGRGIDTENGGVVTADRLQIEDVVELGIRLSDGGTVDVRRAVIRRVTPDTDGTLGRGVEVIGGTGTFTIAQAVVEDVHDSALAAFGADTVMSVSDVVVRRVARNTEGNFGSGIDALDGASVTIRRVRVEDVFEGGVTADAASVLTLEDAIVRGVSNNGLPGAGIAVKRSSLTARRTVIADLSDVGVIALGVDAQMELVDVEIRDVDAAGSSAFGAGVNAYGAATVVLERVRMGRVRTAGLLILEAATIDAEDLLVEDVAAGPSSVGRCVEVSGRATVRVTRLGCERATDAGLLASGDGTRLELADLVIADTRPNATGLMGRGIEIQEGGSARIERARFVGNHEVGILASGEGSTLDLVDVEVIDMRSRPETGTHGRAIQAQQSSSIEGVRVRVAASREVGLLAVNEAAIRLEDVIVEDTRVLDCAETTCLGRGGGTGVNAQRAGIVSLRRFSVRDNPLVGVQLVSGAQVDLVDGEVARNAIGVNIQIPDYDLSRLMRNVRYLDNGTPLDATALPVPDANIE